MEFIGCAMSQMREWCDCDSTWVINKNYETGQIPTVEEENKCKVCTYYRWYDAWYENMIYDLKEMNKC